MKVLYFLGSPKERLYSGERNPGSLELLSLTLLIIKGEMFFFCEATA